MPTLLQDHEAAAVPYQCYKMSFNRIFELLLFYRRHIFMSGAFSPSVALRTRPLSLPTVATCHILPGGTRYCTRYTQYLVHMISSVARSIPQQLRSAILITTTVVVPASYHRHIFFVIFSPSRPDGLGCCL